MAGFSKERGPRILAGEWRGRRLAVPRGRVTRPARALVRRSVFDIIQDQVAGCRWLDLYAGSGSFGLEALSRGAAQATFVEAGRAGQTCLRHNFQELGLTRPRAALDPRRIPGLFTRGALPGHAPFHVASLDPPFAVSRHPAQLAALAAGLSEGGRRGFWVADALLIWEEPAEAAAPPVEGFAEVDRREYGTSRVRLFRYRPAPASA